jgi:two-component system, chemotaxis family, CheB/CheR fusion protein
LALNGRERIPQALHAQEIETIKQLSQADVLEPYRTRRLTKDKRIVDICLTATALINEAGEVYAVATTERPIDQAEEDND